MARRSTAEIKKLLKDTKEMKHKDAAKHLGISMATFYKWKEKAKRTPAAAGSTAKKEGVNKKVVKLVQDLKAKIEKLEKELV